MRKKLKWLIVAGARPNFMKIAPLIREVDAYNSSNRSGNPEIAPVLVHTGQHYDNSMSKVFFEDLGLPEPGIYLGIGSASHSVQTAKIMIEFEKVCTEQGPDIVIVVGDVNSTLACSLVAVKMGIKVAHVEAGLRSFDRTMPEEINRIVTDSISDYLFTTCRDANENLRNEGVPQEKIHFVGNVMVDTLLSHKNKACNSNILEKLGLKKGSDTADYGVLTLHRPANVDNKETFRNILEGIKKISEMIPVIFPAHLRTVKQIGAFNFLNYFDSLADYSGLTNKIHMIDPLGYLDFLNLMSNARIVFTDSGGIQEETTVLGIPCLTIRDNTERPVTVTEGTNTIAGTDTDNIARYSMSILEGKRKKWSSPELWDGKAAERVVSVLVNKGNSI